MEEETKKCPYCGETILAVAQKCRFCGEWLGSKDKNISIISRIADFQKISNIVWLIIGIIQVFSIVCIIAGIWNIVAACNNWKFPKKILNRDSDVPQCYEGIVGLVVLGVVNFFLGGLIGVLLIGFDFYIRHLVLENRQLFVNEEVNA